MQTFRELIRLWPSRHELSQDAKATELLVKQWHLRDSIPAGYWPKLVSAAERRGIESVTLTNMAAIAERQAKQRKRRRAA